MSQAETAVGRFFGVYARVSGGDDIAAMVACFADPFLSAGPQGTQCVRGAEFAAVLPKRKQLFDRLGAGPASLVSLDEHALDARYVLAKTRWRIEFARVDLASTEVLLDSTFLIDTGTEACKIAMYLPQQDVMKVLRERGIMTN